MSCDICGAKGTDLVLLIDSYQTQDIKAICPDCMEVVNRHLRKIRAATHRMNISLLQRFMEALQIKWAKGTP